MFFTDAESSFISLLTYFQRRAFLDTFRVSVRDRVIQLLIMNEMNSVPVLK